MDGPTESCYLNQAQPVIHQMGLLDGYRGSRVTTGILPTDMVVFIIGPSGSGKSWFMDILLQNAKVHAVHANEGQRPGTTEVYVERCRFEGMASDIVLVDTPSFHTHEGPDGEETVKKWMDSARCAKQCKRATILYMENIMSNPYDANLQVSRHLGAFRRTLPRNLTINTVYIVPTMASVVGLPAEAINAFVAQIQGQADFVGATMSKVPFDGRPDVAWDVIAELLNRCGVGSMVYLTETTPRRAALGFRAAFGHLGHHLRSILIDPAALSDRYRKEGRQEDLDEIITLKRTALKYKPQDDPERQTILLELDSWLYERFRKRDTIVDLEEIISLRRAALDRTPPLDRWGLLLRLANSLVEKFQKLGLAADIEEAIKCAGDAMELCPLGHPNRLLSHKCFADCLEMKIKKQDPPSSPFDIKQLIRKVFFETAKNIPLRLLHLPTGVLCNQDAQLSHFERSPAYDQLLSSTSACDGQLLEAQIREAIDRFFPYAMLSHRWGSGEPLLRDVEGKNIHHLRGTYGLEKLHKFCIRALERGCNWAWSDTCCIDKDSRNELEVAIGSMFSWYGRSSVTLVYLSDVSNTGSLADSVWFKRGWTLQELLASHTILFYTQDWSLYKGRESQNHKTDPALLEEIQTASRIAKWHLLIFYPGMDNARARLHWASRRRTTRAEDIAYSLVGIFNVGLPVRYGESAENALGRLLVEIISSSGDVSVLDWVGEPSSFNSCFPVNLVPYQMVPDLQLTCSDSARYNDLDLEKAHDLRSKLGRLPRAVFFNSKLLLPSTVHPVTMVRLQGSSTLPSRYSYWINASRLRPIEVTLSVGLDEGAGTYILVRPWNPKMLEVQTDSDGDGVWKWLEQLEQPFNALLLERLLHNEYRRIASDCIIRACPQDLNSILDSETLIPEII